MSLLRIDQFLISSSFLPLGFYRLFPSLSSHGALNQFDLPINRKASCPESLKCRERENGAACIVLVVWILVRVAMMIAYHA
jgi:hypothetical protein